MHKIFSIILPICLVIAGHSFANSDFEADRSDRHLGSTISAVVVGVGLIYGFASYLNKNSNSKGKQFKNDDSEVKTLGYTQSLNDLKNFKHEYFKNYPYEIGVNENAIENLYDRTFTLLISLYLSNRNLVENDSIWFPEDFLLSCNNGSLGRWECPSKFNGYKGYFIDEDNEPVDYLKEDALAYYAYNLLLDNQTTNKVSRLKEELLIKKAREIYDENKCKTLISFKDAVDSGKINYNSTRDEIHEFLASLQNEGIKKIQEYVEYLAHSCSTLLYCSHPNFLFSGKQILEHSTHPKDVPGRTYD